MKQTKIIKGLLVTLSVFCLLSWSPPNFVHKYEYFTTDNLGNVYLVNHEELLKYLPNGKFFARYSNLRLGDISAVDATNPLKILVYYRNFQQIVFLDNQLSENSESVSLENLGLEQTELVCAGSNNSFWVYNKQNNELLRYDENSKKIASTGNLKQLLGDDIMPVFMLEQNNYLYLNSPQQGIYVFDIFGNYNKLIAIKALSKFQVYDNQMYFQRDSSFCNYDHKLFEENCMSVSPAQSSKGLRFVGNKLYFGYKDSVVVKAN